MRGRTAMTVAAVMLALAGNGVWARAEEPTVVAYLRGHRCMIPTGGPPRGEGGPPRVLAAPRAGAPRRSAPHPTR